MSNQANLRMFAYINTELSNITLFMQYLLI